MMKNNRWKLYLVTIITAVVIGSVIAAGSFTMASSFTENEAQEAVDIALADARIQSLIAGKSHRVIGITNADPNKGEVDLTVAIYVYPDARAIGVPIDLAKRKIVDVLVTDNNPGPAPTVEEVEAAYQIAIADQRMLDIAAGKQYKYHGHQTVSLVPSHPCHNHRCISISIDLKQNDGTIKDHYAIAFVDLVTNKVTGLLLKPEVLDTTVPGQDFGGYIVYDYEGRVITLQEIRSALSVVLQDAEVVNALQDKTHSLVLRSDAPYSVTVSSDVVIGDSGFRNYVKSKVNLQTSSIAERTISTITVEQAKSALEIAAKNPLISQYLGEIGLHEMALEPVQDNNNLLRLRIHPLSGAAIEADVDLPNKSVKNIKGEQ